MTAPPRNESPVVVIAEFRAHPGKADEVLAWFVANLPDTRAFEGCEAVEVYRDPDDADALVLVEHWRSREDHAAYGRWRRESGDSIGRSPLLAAPPTHRYIDRVAS